MDNGVPGEDVIAMRISLGPSGQPSITDGNSSTIEDMLKEMLSQGVEVPGGEVRKHIFRDHPSSATVAQISL